MRFTAVAQPAVVPDPIRIDGTSVSFDDPHIMGILNVTPDSFSDGGKFSTVQTAVEHTRSMITAGATFIDVGGESTRPGADAVDAEEECRRVVPVIAAISELSAWISIDTSKASVAEAALDAGAQVVNDISGFGFDPDMPGLVADRGVPAVLMHIRGNPKNMQDAPQYRDVVDEILAYFHARLELAIKAGVSEEQIILDPGIGFGKTVEQNYEILRRLGEFTKLGRPILLGTSRKSMIGATLNKPATERVWGTAATVAWGVVAGADILRVHDVPEMTDVIRVSERIRKTS